MTANFELQRLLRILDDHLIPNLNSKTLAAEDMEALKKQIGGEGRNIYIEVMNVMCRPYPDEHLRGYLEAHLAGVEYLVEELEKLIERTNECSNPLLEVFKGVVNEILARLNQWYNRRFPDQIRPEEWLDKLQVQKLLGISQTGFYRKKELGKWQTKMIRGTEHYLVSSLYH